MRQVKLFPECLGYSKCSTSVSSSNWERDSLPSMQILLSEQLSWSIYSTRKAVWKRSGWNIVPLGLRVSWPGCWPSHHYSMCTLQGCPACSEKVPIADGALCKLSKHWDLTNKKFPESNQIHRGRKLNDGCQGLQEGVNGQLLVKGYRVSVCKMKALETGCTAV